ncbi:hypothetical protein AB6T85_21795 [Erwinia sp. ACCC 02193]|uniref:Uncharacterized protein n=1 Tax=Erwinia aeris TaxID=3239803 RepID=A0ABV4EDP6_9GAMM
MIREKDFPEYVQRMYEERTELKARIEKASAFATKAEYLKLSRIDRTLFEVQLATMNDYLRLLVKRIERAEQKA